MVCPKSSPLKEMVKETAATGSYSPSPAPSHESAPPAKGSQIATTVPHKAPKAFEVNHYDETTETTKDPNALTSPVVDRQKTGKYKALADVTNTFNAPTAAATAPTPIADTNPQSVKPPRSRKVFASKDGAPMQPVAPGAYNEDIMPRTFLKAECKEFGIDCENKFRRKKEMADELNRVTVLPGATRKSAVQSTQGGVPTPTNAMGPPYHANMKRDYLKQECKAYGIPYTNAQFRNKEKMAAALNAKIQHGRKATSIRITPPMAAVEVASVLATVPEEEEEEEEEEGEEDMVAKADGHIDLEEGGSESEDGVDVNDESQNDIPSKDFRKKMRAGDDIEENANGANTNDYEEVKKRKTEIEAFYFLSYHDGEI